MPRSQQGRRWVFTLNNPSNEEKVFVANALENDDQVVYGVVGRETGANGTPHLQGFVIFSVVQRFGRVKDKLGHRCHIELARGTSVQARDYCQKDGDYDEYGSFPSEQGKRTDLDDLFKWADEFEERNGYAAQSPDIAKEQPHAYLKYPRFSRLCSQRAKRVLFDPVQFYDWQRELEEKLATEPDDRVIDFVVDTEGGAGKTEFCKQMLMRKPEEVQLLSVGKASDLAYSILIHKSIFLFNVPRGQMEFISYKFLEQLKDRIVWSPKYQSQMKFLHKRCHVVVFSNEYPDESKLTENRYNIINVN